MDGCVVEVVPRCLCEGMGACVCGEGRCQDVFVEGCMVSGCVSGGVCAYVCVRACVRACVRVCVYVCGRVDVKMYLWRDRSLRNE